MQELEPCRLNLVEEVHLKHFQQAVARVSRDKSSSQEQELVW